MTGGFRSVLRHLGLSIGVTGLGHIHTYQILVNGEDFTGYWLDNSVTITQPEAGEVGTMHVSFAALGASLEDDLTEWKEVIFKVDGRPYFGGYVVGITRLIDQDQPEGWLTYEVVVEGWETLLNRTPVVRRVYVNENPGAILADLLDYALDPDGSPPSQGDFDVTTYVTAGSWGAMDPMVFLVEQETLTDAINRLAFLAGFTWWIDAGKYVHFGPASSSPAPFAIAEVTAADYSTSFPPNSRPAHRTDGADVRNRVTVHGGIQVLQDTDNFAGDGATSRFQLSHFPVVDMVLITVDGLLQSWGTYFYHSWEEFDVLIDWSAGLMYFDPENPPADEAAIVATYLYGDPVLVTVDNGTAPGSSYDTYGRWFDFEIIDGSITSPELAEAIAQAIVDEYEFAATVGTVTVEKLGVKPGQELTIEFPSLGLSGAYTVRRVITEIVAGMVPRCEIGFGGRPATLNLALSSSIQIGPATPSTIWSEQRALRTLSSKAELVAGSMTARIGTTSTDQLDVNTSAPSGATAYQWPVYDAKGNLAGYVPVYGAAW